MADFPLLNDGVYTVPIQATDSAGAVVPLESGDTYTVVSSAPTSLGAAMGSTAAGNAAVVLTPLVQTATGITITVSDANGLTAATAIFDIVADTTPVALVLDLPDATHVPQPVPSAAPAA